MSWDGKIILLANEEEEIRKQVESTVTEKEGELVWARSVMQAFRSMSNKQFDLILIDYELPGMSGLQIASAAKSSPLNNKTPIMIVSNKITEAQATKAKLSGINDIYKAPLDMGAIVERAEEAWTPEGEESSKYDLRIVNCFISAVRDVFKFYVGHTPRLGQPAVVLEKSIQGYVTAIMGLSGHEAAGALTISFDKQFMNYIAEKVLGEKQIRSLKGHQYGDLAGELCNQICGKLKGKFGNLGIRLELGIPEVVVGDNHFIYHKATTPVLSVSIHQGGWKGMADFCMLTDFEKLIVEDIEEETGEDFLSDGMIMFDE